MPVPREVRLPRRLERWRRRPGRCCGGPSRLPHTLGAAQVRCIHVYGGTRGLQQLFSLLWLIRKPLLPRTSFVAKCFSLFLLGGMRKKKFEEAPFRNVGRQLHLPPRSSFYLEPGQILINLCNRRPPLLSREKGLYSAPRFERYFFLYAKRGHVGIILRRTGALFPPVLSGLLGTDGILSCIAFSSRPWQTCLLYRTPPPPPSSLPRLFP